MPNRAINPKVVISDSGVAAYTFTRQTDDWTWMSSNQPNQKPYDGTELPIQAGGTVTVIDGTKSFEFGSLSRALENRSIPFIVSGANKDVFHVTLEDQPQTAVIYYIQNVNSGLYLQASSEEGAQRGVTQQNFSPSESGFQWRLIDLGNNVFRIFSVGTGRLLFASSAAKQTPLQVSTNPNSGAIINWLKDGNFFQAVSSTNLVWDVKNASKSAGEFVQIFPKKDSSNGNQQFKLSTTQPS